MAAWRNRKSGRRAAAGRGAASRSRRRPPSRCRRCSIRRRRGVSRNALPDGARVRPAATPAARLSAEFLSLTASQFIVLIGTAYRQGREGVSIRTLADHTQLAATHVTTEVGRLIGKGLLTKQASTRDRRSVLVRLTPQGRGRDPRRQPAAAPRQRPAVPEVSREDFAVVSRFLQTSRSTANTRWRNSAAPSASATHDCRSAGQD